MKVGFIGLGKMGTAMAGRILDGGHEIAVYNRTASKASELVGRGAKLAETVGKAASFSDVVITMVENDKALTSVVHDAGGILQSLPKGGIHLAMGTHSVAMIQQLTEAHAKAGQVLVSAPVLGRPPAAAAGQIGIITGGPADAVAKVKPLFDAMGRRTFDCGTQPAGAASAKIANNFILACAIEALAEGIVLAEKCGVEGASFVEILTDGLFSAPAYKVYGKIIADRSYFENPGFEATTGLKDVNLALSAGETVGVPLPSANVCRDHLVSAIARGNGKADWAVMADEQARAASLVK
jgi:3-hydroxyisobutyrate dehydrogenase-like beta-hydroxyacid dehydrogenase